MRTYYYSDVLNYISSSVPRMVDSDKSVFISNLAIAEIYKQYDFRESLATLNPFYLVPNTQDHGAPMVVIPSDFLGLRKVYLTRYNSIPIFRQDVAILKDLELTHFSGLPDTICYQPATNSFRVFPRVPANIGCPEYVMQGEYKKVPPKVTSSTLSSTLLPFADHYFYNLAEVFRWAAFHTAGDPRAGGVQTNNRGVTQYVGAFASAQDAIQGMAANEGLELGTPNIAPREALAITSNSGFGLGSYNRMFN